MLDTLYITDLDGSLLTSKGTLSAATVEILRPLIADGLPLAVATARTPATAVALLEPLHITLPAILMTGAMLYDLPAHKSIEQYPIVKTAVAAVCEILALTRPAAFAYCVKNGELLVYYRALANKFAEHFYNARSSSPYKRYVQDANLVPKILDSDALLIMLCLESMHEVKAYYTTLARVPDIQIFFYPDPYYAEGYIFEICSAKNDKGTGAANLRALLGAKRVVGIGDNVNDLPLFKACDESCAVANATDAVKRAATRVIDTNDVDGVAKWIAEDWNARKGSLSI